MVSGSFYEVEPTEIAGVRRLGTVVSAQPVGPELHVKLPVVDVQLSGIRYSDAFTQSVEAAVRSKDLEG